MLTITLGPDSAPAPTKWVVEGGVGTRVNQKVISGCLIHSLAVVEGRIPLQAALGH